MPNWKCQKCETASFVQVVLFSVLVNWSTTAWLSVPVNLKYNYWEWLNDNIISALSGNVVQDEGGMPMKPASRTCLFISVITFRRPKGRA